MIEDEADDAIPFQNIEEDDVSEFANTVRLRDAARRTFVAAETDARLRRAVAARTRPDRLVYSTGDRVYYWRSGAWHLQSAVVVSQIGAGHYYIDSGGRVFKVAAEQLRSVSEREQQAWDAVREGQQPGPELEDIAGAGPLLEAPDADGARPEFLFRLLKRRRLLLIKNFVILATSDLDWSPRTASHRSTPRWTTPTRPVTRLQWQPQQRQITTGASRSPTWTARGWRI